MALGVNNDLCWNLDRAKVVCMLSTVLLYKHEEAEMLVTLPHNQLLL